AQEGPTILRPQPLVSSAANAKAAEDNTEALPIPRPIAPADSNDKASAGAEPSKSRPPTPSGTEENGPALVPSDATRLIQETDALKAERQRLKFERDETTPPMDRIDP